MYRPGFSGCLPGAGKWGAGDAGVHTPQVFWVFSQCVLAPCLVVGCVCVCVCVCVNAKVHAIETGKARVEQLGQKWQ